MVDKVHLLKHFLEMHHWKTYCDKVVNPYHPTSSVVDEDHINEVTCIDCKNNFKRKLLKILEKLLEN